MVRETDPLISLPGKTASTVRRNNRKKRRRNCLLVTVGLGILAMVVGSMVVIKKASNQDSDSLATSVLGKAKTAKSKVYFDKEEGDYEVDYDVDTITQETTFSELAKIFLLPWYEASIVAVLDDPAWKSDEGIMPYNIRPIRQVLLITRSMLDVFSPVFPNTPYGKKARIKTKSKPKNGKEMNDKSLWKKLRKLYRHGYQISGELHDLDGLTYSKDLLTERQDAVLEWKKEFVAFQKSNRIRRYLYSSFQSGTGGMDPNGCYDHGSSHLFWADEETRLPCGSDPGTASLRSLGSVQLEHSLGYLETIKDYTTVMPQEHEINFHNLRKELRIFVDEYDLFGSVLVPDNGDEEDLISSSNTTLTTVKEQIHFLDKTQKKLGHINDKWTAYNIYVEDNASTKKQEHLANQTDSLWFEFLDWQEENNLKETMESVLHRINS